MKKILLVSLLLSATLHLFAQAPQQFSFQGVARDSAGKVIANTTVSLRLTIHEALPGGVNVYQETHKPLTSNGGIFTVSVGTGNDKSGNISDIKWSAGSFFLQVELDAAGGTNYVDLGATQLLSVPYALHAAQADKWKDGDPIVQSGEVSKGGILDNLGTGPKLIWYPRRAAFRAGYVNDDSWDDSKIGAYSTAFGSNTRAEGNNSMAFGQNTKANGIASFAVGTGSQANNTGSLATGLESIASGAYSFASGKKTIASEIYSFSTGMLTQSQAWASFVTGVSTISKSYGGTVVGIANDIQDNPGFYSSAPNDRIFQIGNGDIDADNNAINRKNALTVLKNGNIGIGGNVLSPGFILDIGARPRIRHNPSSPNGTTAGVFFDDSNGSPEGFIGMKSNSEIGLWNADKWLFWMDSIGNAHILGTNYNTSDRRLKRNFSSLSNSLTKLTDLNGYHYFWKDSTLDQSLQTGLIAQEVEAIFPELVKTDEKGFKSVNYTGLIPHLIESVKELDKKYQEVKSENEALKVALKRVDKLEAALNKLAPNTNEVSQTSVK
ncbi:tail fiber domain-containing protein [Dyadobacter pollutisoli]|uniref:Tail fiber domain-containing protein n=1 Tax=Dyadobacter pollutisoli TaxID=2910158 RepID=A0A9E8NED5_9BACT|nr:tail fiber domain-containing protein [Dyadobacter pollutisoli]WAC13753.1 tail fiber domain-containing protein [Dyadobacter pollutisoli]